jgi:hypothetical protein
MTTFITMNLTGFVERSSTENMGPIRVAYNAITTLLAQSFSGESKSSLKHAHPKCTQRPVRVQSTQRVYRSTAKRTHSTKRTSSSGSSDSDGGPSASDSSDRCYHCNILCYTPLLHSHRCSSNKLTSLCIPASFRFVYSHALNRISIFLSWLTFSILRPILIEITTSYRVGVNHV